MEINAVNGISASSHVAGAGAADAKNYHIDFGYGIDDDYFQAEATKTHVTKQLKANIDKFELVQPGILASLLGAKAHFKVAGDGKMTCRQLREMLKIPPGFLSNTNGKRLKDTDIVEDLKVNLSDIGWYEHSYGEFEASSIRVRRNHGEYWAGYNSAISNDEIKQIYFQNKK